MKTGPSRTTLTDTLFPEATLFGTHLPVLERLDQRAGEYDAATPSFRQSLIDQLVGPRLHGGGDFRAETASQRRLLACDEITIEPGRAIGADLLAKRDRKRTRLNSSH